jgi:6-phosphofructo-2-kinase/fructose-2,6-biphosphatase 4
LLIIGHASVIRCLVSTPGNGSNGADVAVQLAYLVGLPPSEVPAVEIARGDLVEVVPASYGVLSRAFHFWYVLPPFPACTTDPLACRSGEGRGDATGANLYENFAESTIGKVNDMENVLPPAAEDLQEKAEAEEEEERAKEGGGGDKKLGRSMSFLKI